MKNSVFFAALAYTAINLIYGNTEQVDVGFTLFPTESLEMFGPLIAAAIPWISKIRKKDNTLDLINQLEVKTVTCPESTKACQALRTQALKRLKDEKTPSPPVSPT